MATTTLQLRIDSDGNQTLVIGHESDPDALSYEHEEDHQEMANKVIEGGIQGNSKINKKRGASPVQENSNKGHEILEKESVSSDA